jgi:Ca2+-binding RTX toxin-like protein
MHSRKAVRPVLLRPVLATLAALGICAVVAGSALGAVSSSVSDGRLTVASDGSDSIALGCSAGKVAVNGVVPVDLGAVDCSTLTGIFVSGGPGANTIDLSGVHATDFPNVFDVSVNGGAGDDTIVGSELADSLDGGAGADTIDGKNGSDMVFAAPGDGDVVTDTGTGLGDGDVFVFHRETSVGMTVTVGANGDVTVDGAVAVRGAGFEDTEIDGGRGDDVLDASAATVPVVIDASYGGTDTLIGGSAADYLYSGPGTSHLDGRGGADTYGLSGTDTVADSGADSASQDTIDVVGTAGPDAITIGAGVLTVNGITSSFSGIESVTVEPSEGDDVVDGSQATVDLSLDGGGGNDTLTGGSGDDQIDGGSGDDLIQVADGGDAIDGQDGSDQYFVLFNLHNDVSADGSSRSLDGATISDSGASGTDSLDYDCNAGATDSGTRLSAAGASVAYVGIEVSQCGSFSSDAGRPTFTPRPAAASGSTTTAPTPPPPAVVCTINGVGVTEVPPEYDLVGGLCVQQPPVVNSPVSAPAAPGQPGAVTAVVQPVSTGAGTPAPPVTVAASWPAGTFTTPVTVTVTPQVPAPVPAGTTPPPSTPVAGGFTVGGTTVQLTVTDASGAKVTSFQAPLVIHISASQAGDVPAYSRDGTSWITIPQLSGPNLPEGQPDGYFVNSDGSIDIYTRHATLFGLLKDAQAPTAPTLKAQVGGNKLYLLLKGAKDNDRVAGYQVLFNGRRLKTALRGYLVLPARAGRFQVIAVDTAGNKSKPSAAVKVVRHKRGFNIAKS